MSNWRGFNGRKAKWLPIQSLGAEIFVVAFGRKCGRKEEFYFDTSLTARIYSLGEAPHPVPRLRDHLLPRAEKDTPRSRRRGNNLEYPGHFMTEVMLPFSGNPSRVVADLLTIQQASGGFGRKPGSGNLVIVQRCFAAAPKSSGGCAGTEWFLKKTQVKTDAVVFSDGICVFRP